MNALQIGPPVAPAIEDPIVVLIDRTIVVRPEPGLCHGIHPGVHRRRHQPASQRRQEAIDSAHVPLKSFRQRLESRRGLRHLQLDQVQHQLVGPRNSVQIDLGHIRRQPGAAAEQLIGDRQDVQAVGADDRILQLDAEDVEKMVGGSAGCRQVGAGGDGNTGFRFVVHSAGQESLSVTPTPPWPCASMRRRKTSMMRR